MTALSFIAINIGNTRTQIARFDAGELEHLISHDNKEPAAIVQTVLDAARAIDTNEGSPVVVIGSVNDSVGQQIERGLIDQLQADVYQIGRDLPVPIGTQLDPETITGVDRLLNAAAAFAVLKQACIVIDAGTAMTVDFVDGDGTFHGGAIAPGAQSQLRALHQQTDALPEIEFGVPDETFGRSTTQAMLQGVYHGLRGLVWKLVERYAEEYEAFPVVVATGGDAEVLFGDDDLIDRIVPDLTVQGIAQTARVALSDAGPGDYDRPHRAAPGQ